MLDILSGSKIYILCPPNFATGGTELLHQLSYKLNRLGMQAFMFYTIKSSDKLIHPQFMKYEPVAVTRIEDERQNILIIPEVYIDYPLDDFKEIRKVIWWLSIDFFFKAIDEKIARKKKKPFFKLKKFIGRYKFPDLDFVKSRNFHHIVQSVYARNFLQDNGITVHGYLSDYLNSTFLDNVPQHFDKQDIVAYNPKKGFEYTAKLMEAAPDITWLALENMTPDEVKNSLSKSKVYIDFGNHPGKDRFPREAAMMDCCIITGMRGAALNNEDLPLPLGFKFDEAVTDIQDILKKIRLCFADYESQSGKFESYRERIKQEESIFDQDLHKIFVQVNG